MLTESTCRPLLDVLLSRGGDFAEIFCEHSARTELLQDEGHVDSAVAGEESWSEPAWVHRGRPLRSRGKRPPVPQIFL